MQDCVVGEAARAEGDRSSVCVVEVFHEQIYVGLLGAIPRRPGRLNVVLDALERKALRLLYDVNDGHPIGSTVVTCISQHRLPEPAFLIRSAHSNTTLSRRPTGAATTAVCARLPTTAMDGRQPTWWGSDTGQGIDPAASRTHWISAHRSPGSAKDGRTPAERVLTRRRKRPFLAHHTTASRTHSSTAIRTVMLDIRVIFVDILPGDGRAVTSRAPPA